MRNFVSKHNFNRAAVHKTAKDYTRSRMQARSFDLYEEDMCELLSDGSVPPKEPLQNDPL